MSHELQNDCHEQVERDQLLIDSIPGITLYSKILEELLLDYIVKFGLTAVASEHLQQGDINLRRSTAVKFDVQKSEKY